MSHTIMPLDAKPSVSLDATCRRIRRKIVESLHRAQSGHLGPSLSVVELLAALYFEEMNLASPDARQRDVLVLSKGHAAPALYAVLAERGLIPEHLLATLREWKSPLQGHPERHRLAWIDATTGSLGQGLSLAQGYALGFKLRREPFRVHCILGDGECQEGQIWEAAMSAVKFKLDNLVCIVDANGLQNDGRVEDQMPLDTPAFRGRWEAFGWDVKEIDGHHFGQIRGAFRAARDSRGRPTLILARTIKGKGLSFAENSAAWHSKVLDHASVQKALSELSTGS